MVRKGLLVCCIWHHYANALLPRDGRCTPFPVVYEPWNGKTHTNETFNDCRLIFHKYLEKIVSITPAATVVPLKILRVKICAFLQAGAVKLVLWRHWMHLSYMHPLTSEKQFHCTRLYMLWCSLAIFCISDPDNQGTMLGYQLGLVLNAWPAHTHTHTHTHTHASTQARMHVHTHTLKKNLQTNKHVSQQCMQQSSTKPCRVKLKKFHWYGQWSSYHFLEPHSCLVPIDTFFGDAKARPSTLRQQLLLAEHRWGWPEQRRG